MPVRLEPRAGASQLAHPLSRKGAALREFASADAVVRAPARPEPRGGRGGGRRATARRTTPTRSRHDPETAAAAVRRGVRPPEGAGRRGRVEQPRPRARLPGLHGGLGVAQPRRVLPGPDEIRAFLQPQVGARARLRAAQGPLDVRGQPHRGALPVRVARRRRPVVALLRQRELGVRRRRADAPPRGVDQRRRRSTASERRIDGPRAEGDTTGIPLRSAGAPRRRPVTRWR